MKKRPTIFVGKQATYKADNCEPLVEAAEKCKVDLKAVARGSYPGLRFQSGELKGISTVGFWNAIGDQNWGLDYHRNEGIEFTYLETGSTPFIVDDSHYILKPHDLTITRPWQPHRVGDPCIHAGKLYWIIIDVGVRRPNQPWKWPDWLVLTKQDLESLTTILRQNEQPVWHQVNPEIGHCFQKIGKAVSMHAESSQISKLSIYINEILLHILEMFKERDVYLNPSLSTSQRTVELFFHKLKDDINHLSHAWTVDELASQCGLGVTAFTQYCKEITNMTPSQYLNHARVEAAANLLKSSPELNITDIALQCGFYSGQYFATVFKQVKGMTPIQFRKMGN